MVSQPEILFEGHNSTVYLKGESEYGKPVVIKVMKHNHPSQEQVSLFNNEFDITQGLEISGIRQVYEKTKVDGKSALVMEYINGIPIKEYYQKEKMSLDEFLDIATKTCQVLGEIHQHHIIHKDIDSQNILITPEKEIKIIDFGISTKYSLKSQGPDSPEKLEGTLAYISPEQTGRMNRLVDNRSDLYSLGIVFYELLTGRVPFTSTDPLELVHSHLAQSPEPPNTHNPEIPELISDIILKLLRKNAVDRYQSAFGIKADLEKAHNYFQRDGKIPAFELAREDFSGKLSVPNKLYGRQKEIEFLLDSFERTCQGTSELVLIAGKSGVGKSALVHQIHKPITERKGFFIEGKFDQFQKNIPYLAFIQAFKSFVNHLLTESAQQMEMWRESIEQAIGVNGKVLTDVIPALELIIGKQPDVPELGPTESQNRFKLVFQNFVNAISQREHPLVIFIDDWQWADAASLNLLSTLLTNRSGDYTLFMGAYRVNEVDPSHPFMMMLEEIRKENPKIHTLLLDNLSQINLNELISDALRKDAEELQELSDLIFQKTQGNAFFVRQMLQSLYEENLLQFDFEAQTWTWDLSKIRAMNITDNVVDLMSQKIQKLSDQTQTALKLAACFGNRFSIHNLAIAKEKNDLAGTKLVEAHLEPAVAEGLLIALDEDYKFAHDRIHQAVYSLIPDEEKMQKHLRIGRLLVQSISPEQQEELLFDIANHWNYAIDLLEDENERKFSTKLNLRAGIKARASAAYKPAYSYLEMATRLLDAQSWETDYAITLEVYSEILQAAFLKGDLELSEKYIQIVLENGKDILDKMPAYEIEMQYHIARGDQRQALNTGLEVIDLLHITLAGSPYEIPDIESVYNLPDIRDERVKAALEIMDSIITPAWALDPRLFEQITYTMVNLSVDYGNSASACVGYAFYGGVLCAKLGDIENGYKFGKLAIRLLDKYNARFFKAKVDNLFASRVLHWKEAARESGKIHFEAIQVGLETGEIEFASYNIVEACHYNFLVGSNLDNLKIKYEKNLSLIRQLKQEFHVNYLSPWVQMIHNLLEEQEDPCFLNGTYFQEEVFLPQFEKENQLTLSFITYQAKTLLAFLFKDFEAAYLHVTKADQYKEGVTGMLYQPVHNFLYSLIMIARFPEASMEEKQTFLKEIDSNQKQLKIWAYHSPNNYQHKYDLVMAETLRLSGQNTRAMDYYDRAIDGAVATKYLWEEALANELAADFYIHKEKSKIAKPYILDAYYAYQTWGCIPKLNQLEKEYTRFLRSSRPNHAQLTSRNVTLGSISGLAPNLDMHTIIKASQTLSGEVVLSNLLQKMMRIVIENAGAQKGYFIQPSNGQWVIEAECDLQSKEVEAMKSIPIDQVDGLSDKPKLSSELLYYVIRTRENIVINDANQKVNMLGASYVEKCNPKSVLALPLIYHGKLSGILYLENNLTTDAFTPNRLEILEILSTQITISIENALLYENLEEKVKERTAEVVKAKEIIENKNQSITASINYAKRIQDAMLPQMSRVKALLPESFIFFKPRDIVSGDFYWCSKIEPQPILEDLTQDGQTRKVLQGYDSEKTVICAVDCTGHGVPGAFMSLIGNDLLNEIVDIARVSNPAKILEELNEGVRLALRQQQTDNKDGMDVALCVIDYQDRTLEFAGAKNPLVYIQDGVLHEIKGDKMPVGGFQKANKRDTEFTKHQVSIRKPTYCYIYSDGYQDQFGGEFNRKFMVKRLKQMFLEIHQEPMEKQKRILQNTLDKWMENEKQIDDILIIGFKVG